MRITLGLPPKGCWPNDRVHHYAKARAIRAYRREAAISARIAMGSQIAPRWAAARTLVTFAFTTRPDQWRDPDNCAAALKPVWDGFQDVDLLANDRQLVHEPIARVTAPKGSREHVLIELEEIQILTAEDLARRGLNEFGNLVKGSEASR